MASSMRIDIAFGGLTTGASALDRVADRMERIARANGSILGGPGGGSGGFGGATRSTRGGPLARYNAAQAALALRPGDFDAQFRALSAQNSLSRAQNALRPKGFSDRLNDLIGTSRINLPGVGGMGVAPLANRLEALFGPAGSVIAPVVVGFAAAASASKLLADTVIASSGRIGEFSSARSISGGTTGELARLTAFGFSPGGAANTANAVRDRIATDPLAQSVAMRAGVGGISSSAFGPQNNLKVLESLYDYLRSIPDETEQLREARKLGLEGSLEELRVSKQVYEAQKQEADIRQKLFSGSNVQAGRDFNAELKLTGLLWDDLTGTFSSEALPDALILVNVINDTLTDALPLAQQLGETTHDLFTGMMDAAVMISAVLNGMDPGQAVDAARMGRDAAKALAGALQKNTNAIAANTAVQAGLQVGIFGGSNLSRQALPRYMLPEDARRAAEKKALGLGAFAL